MIYSSLQMPKANWYQIWTGENAYPQPESNFGYKDLSYDKSNYCSQCRLGLIQNKPIRLSSDINNQTYDFLGLHWLFDIIFVRLEAEQILKKNFPELKFQHPVRNSSSEPITNLNQLIINHKQIIGLLDPDNKSKKCDKCGRRKFYYQPHGTVCIDKNSLKNPKFDFIQSLEFIGESPHHLNLISKHGYEVLTSYKFKGIKFSPVLEQ